jgi:hypothetical protein
MSSNLKSPPEGLKYSECKKGKLVARPPMPYVPPVDLHKKREPEQIKVKLPDRTNFQMAAFGNGNNKEYLIHVVAILRIIEHKRTEQDVRKAFQVLVEVRREMKPLFEFPDDKTEAKKEEQKQKFSSTRKSSRPRRELQLLKPRRCRKFSVALSSASRKLSGASLSMRCTPRIHGLA